MASIQAKLIEIGSMYFLVVYFLGSGKGINQLEAIHSK